MGGNGYYKQKVEYSFIFEERYHHGTFNNSPNIGPLFEGDSVRIEIQDGDAKSCRVLNRLVEGRIKSPPISSESLEINAFDSTTIEFYRKNRLKQIEITN